MSIDGFYMPNGDIEKYDYNGLVNKPFVTPEMFGAKGDGATDDTLAVQEAIDSGLSVRLINSYYLTSSLRIQESNRSLIGYNGASLISESGNILIVGSSSKTISNVFVSNILFSCRGTSNAVLVSGERINKLYISYCVFDRFSSYGISVDGATGYNYVDRCRFYSDASDSRYIHFGVSSSSVPINYWYVKNNAFEFGTGSSDGSNKNAILIESGVMLEITNNDFANWNSGDVVYLKPTTTISGVSIKDNDFYNIGDSTCININRSDSSSALYDVSVDGNYFTSQSRTGACIVSSADTTYDIKDIILGKNKIKGSWTKIYDMNRVDNIYISSLNRVESGTSLPAISSLCSYQNVRNVHPPVIKSYFAYATIPAGESSTLTVELKNVPYTLQSYNPVLYINHSTGTGAIISALSYDNTTGVISVTIDNNATGARNVRLSIV